jgi:hypothetical protein
VTILKCERDIDEVGVWKTSALAILFNGLDDEVMKDKKKVWRMGDMRRKARGMKVRLEPD